MLRWRQIVLDEEVTMLEEIADAVFPSLPLACRALRRGRGRSATLGRQLVRRQRFSHFGHGPQDRLGQFFDHMEFADLVRHAAKHLTQRLGIQRRAVRGDTQQLQPAQSQCHPKAVEEGRDVLVIRIVVKYLKQEPFESAVVHNGQDTERAIVQLVSRDVPREVSQAPVEVGRPHLPGCLFPPRPPPSFG